MGAHHPSSRRRPAPRRAAEHAALRERNALLSRLLDYASDVAFRTRLRPEMALEYVSPGLLGLIGYHPAELLARPDLLIVLTHPDDRAVAGQLLSGLSGPRSFDYRLFHRDGRTIWVELHCTPVFAPDGALVALEGVARDISRRKAAEDALRESESRYRHVVELQSELVCRYDPESCVLTFVNEAYCRTFGRSRDELLGSSFLPLISPISRATVAGRAAAFCREQPIRVTELAVTVADGSQRWQQWFDRAIFDDAGRVVDVICVGHDITERVRADEELRRLNNTLERRVEERTAELSASNDRLQAAVAERDRAAQELAAANMRLAGLNRDLAHSQSLLRAVVDSLADALALIAPGGAVQIANHALGALLGTLPDALHGRPWASLGLPGVAQIARAAASGLVCGGREQVARPGQRTVVVDVQAIPLADSGEAPFGVVVRLSDVTEQVQLEALAIANERLAANGRLAAIVAHEINTPLQAIENLLYLAGGGGADEHGYLPLVRDEIRRVSAILRRLLSLSHPDSGPAGSLDCALVIDRVLVLTGTSLARRGISVARNLPAQLPAVPGSADELTQVILNLVVNALDAMPGGGQLAINVDLRDDELHVAISDSGPGVDAALRERIFEPFFTTRPEGTGLGLAVARRIIAQHGGRIGVERGPLGGAHFVIALPLQPGGAAPS